MFDIGKAIKVAGNGRVEKIFTGIKACEGIQAPRTIRKWTYKVATRVS